jgi:predicted secreted protein
MGKVKGQDVVLYLYDLNDKCNHPIACGRSVTFDIQQDMIETSITGNGRFRTYVPGAASWSASVEGLVSIVNVKDVTIQVGLTRYYQAAIPNPITGFILETTGLCIKIGGTLIVSGTDNADGTYTVANYGDYLGAIRIITVEPVPAFTPVDPATVTYQELSYGIDNMYDSIISGQGINIEFYETDDDGHFLRKGGVGYIESINETASFDNMATFTANFKGNGLVDITYG